MNLKNFYLLLLLSFVSVSSFTSCSDDDGENILITEGIYVLNNGKMGNNNTSVTFYDPVAELGTSDDIYETVNGKKLGDTGQDIILYKDRIYLTVYSSNRISVMTRDLVEIASIVPERDGKTQSPRNLIAYDGNVYVSLYDGYVARINTRDYIVEKQIKVGRNPEQLAVSSGKLFVANSGGMDYPNYDNTVSVIDLKTFTMLDTIEVAINPTKMLSDKQGNIYCVSMGNYGDVPNTLQKIDPDTHEVKTIGNATEMTTDGEKLYLLYSQYDANSNQVVTYPVYDAVNQKMITDDLLQGSAVKKPCSITYEPRTGYLYIGTSDYKNNGDMYAFDKTGKQVAKFNVGITPVKALYID